MKCARLALDISGFSLLDLMAWVVNIVYDKMAKGDRF